MSHILCAGLRASDWLQLFLPANESMYEMMDELTRVDPEPEKQEGGRDRLGSGGSIDQHEGRRRGGKERDREQRRHCVCERE